MKLKGIIFDLDSTLVQSHVDFPKMKKRIIKRGTCRRIAVGQLEEAPTAGSGRTLPRVTRSRAEALWT